MDLPAEEDATELRVEAEYMLHPYLNANAEREMEWGDGRSRAADDEAGLEPAMDDEHKTARALLTRANTAIGRGDVATARQVLRDYDENVSVRFFAAQRAQLEASIRALDATSGQRLP